jgi:hypothetical protein
MDLPNAENINYWKTSKSSPDSWMDKTEAIIEKLGGDVLVRARGKSQGRKAFLLEFVFGSDKFRALWPILPSETGNNIAAERQAATLLFYDVKSRSLKFHIFGAKSAFFDFYMIENGKTIGQLSDSELIDYMPKMLPLPNSK